MKKLKITYFVILSGIAYTMFGLTNEELANIHKKEAEATAEAECQLTKNLIDRESALWLKSIFVDYKSKITEAPYPSNVLTTEEVNALLSAITKLEGSTTYSQANFRVSLSDDKPRYQYRGKTFMQGPSIKEIFENIRTNALAINKDPKPISYLQARGFWKPILQNYFKRIKAIIQSYGPQKQVQAHAQDLQGDSDHYFIAANPGEALRKL